MITNLKLKFGRAPGVAPTPISPASVTVFVGPNNSGKSLVLQEIEQYCRIGQKQASAVILDELSASGLAVAEIPAAIDSLRAQLNPGESQHVGTVLRCHVANAYGYA